MFRDCSLHERCRSSISAPLQLQLHSNSHNSLTSYLSPLHLEKRATNEGFNLAPSSETSQVLATLRKLKSLSVGKLDLVHVKLAHLLGLGKGLVRLRFISRLEAEKSIQAETSIQLCTSTFKQFFLPPRVSQCLTYRTM